MTRLFSIIICCLLARPITAQIKKDTTRNFKLEYDTHYIQSYKYYLTTRLYISQKYTAFTLPSLDNKHILFRPNTTVNQGFGWTYRGFTINLAYGFPGINGDASVRGKTSKLDWQMHLYGRKNTIDVFMQRYRGYYVNEGVVPDFQGFYSDSDIKVRHFGGVYSHIHNWKKYSFRFGIAQDEFQKISAGSLFYGATALFTLVKNDVGGLMTQEVAGLERYLDINRINTWNFGPHIGYGYNLILFKHFFVGTSINIAATLSTYQENKGMGSPNPNTGPYFTGTTLQLAPSSIARVAVGYQTDKWGLAFYCVHHTHLNKTYTDQWFSGSVGNYRANIFYRFLPNKKVKKILKPYEWVFK
jgi:hypothetical protein